MIFGRLGVIQSDQRGFTLVEMLIVIAITGLITGAITMTVFQVFNINTRTTNRMNAVRQVQHAGKQVSQDSLQAQYVVPEDNPGTPELLTLTWTDWGNAAQHEIFYNLEDMPSGGFKILQREHYINSSLNSTTNVAEYIDPDPDQTSCYWDGSVFTFTVTATVGGQSETRVYEVMPRSGS